MAFRIKQLKRLNKKQLLFLEKKEEEIFHSAGINRYLLPVFAKYGKLFVIYKDNNIVGMAEFMSDWGDIKKVYLVGFSVFSEYQRHGVGKRFLSGLIERLKKENIEKIELTVDLANKKAFNLYLNAGFVKKEFSKDEYGPGNDRYIMELSLKE